MKKNVRFLWFHDLLLQPWFSNRSHCFPFYSVSHEVYSRIYFVSKYAWKLFLTAFENTHRGWWWLISPLSFPLQSPSAVRSNFTTLCTLGTIIDRRSNFSIFNSTCHQQPLQRSRRPLTRGRQQFSIVEMLPLRVKIFHLSPSFIRFKLHPPRGEEIILETLFMFSSRENFHFLIASRNDWNINRIVVRFHSMEKVAWGFNSVVSRAKYSSVAHTLVI